MQVLPGDPARVALGVNASEDAVQQLREDFGLNRSLLVQYLDWAGGWLRADLGVSYVSRLPIGPQIGSRLTVSAWLIAAGMSVAVLAAVPLGMTMALWHRRRSGVALTALSQVGVAVPAFVAGIVLIAVFAVQLRWLPAGGWTPPQRDVGMFARQLVLPALSLGLVQGAVLSRYVRSAVLDVMREDYIRTAMAKGRSRWGALVRHGLRNAAIPVVTVLGLQLATLLIGAVVVERVFVIPGLGSLLLDGVADRDLLLVQNVVMVLVLAVIVVNAIVDIAYLIIDPRVRQVAR
ncbi:MAG: ABC transporter permease [Micrococcales bacterium]|nr:MAG: ABC transporter permease [Micrococcales bacterium]